MNLVEPKMYLIADPGDTGQMVQFLEDSGVKWRPDPNVSFTENLIEFGGRLCYWSFETEDGFDNKNLTRVREGNKEYLRNIIKRKHGSVVEHNGLVFLFNNVSRVFTHELVRHRVGTSFSQTSGRYVRLDSIPFWMPPCIREVPEAKDAFLDVLDAIETAQKQLADIYAIDSLPMFEKKKLTSAFRRIAPIGIGNNILLSTNHRQLRHMIEMRTSKHAEEEIRLMFWQVAAEMATRFPSIYQDMTENEDMEWVFANSKI